MGSLKKGLFFTLILSAPIAFISYNWDVAEKPAGVKSEEISKGAVYKTQLPTSGGVEPFQHISPTDRAIWAKFQGGSCQAEGNYDEAIDLYLKGLASNPTNPSLECDLLTGLATAKLAQGNAHEALSLLDQAFDLKGVDAISLTNSWMALAGVHMHLENWEEAERALNSAVNTYVNNPLLNGEVGLRRGEIAFHEGHLDKALSLFETAPQLAESQFYIGKIKESRADYSGSIEALQKGLNLTRNQNTRHQIQDYLSKTSALWARNLTDSAVELIENQQDDLAIPLLKQAMNLNAGSGTLRAYIHTTLGDIEYEKGEVSVAIDLYKKALSYEISDNSLHVQWLMSFADMLESTGDLSLACDSLEKATSLHHSDPELASMALSKAQSLHYQLAEKFAKEGAIAEKEGDFEKASNAYLKASKVHFLNNKEKTHFLYKAGNSFSARGKWNEAIDHFQASLALLKGSESNARLETTLQEALAAASRHAKRAIEPIVIKSSTKCIQNAKEALSIGNTPRAIELFQHVQSLSPSSEELGESFYMIGKILYKQGHIEESLLNLENASKIDTTKSDIKAKYTIAFADMLKTTGNTAQALDVYGEALKIKGIDGNTIAQLYNNIGILRFKQGDSSGAQAAYYRGLSSKGVTESIKSRLHYNLGMLLKLKGKTQAAREQLSKALSMHDLDDEMRLKIEKQMEEIAIK